MLKPGETFERYTIDSVLGQGGMGTVYRAHDQRLDRRVALKVISEGGGSDDATARLIREARAAAAIDHPNTVCIYDVGEREGAPYIVMELVPGRTLREAMGASIPLPIRVGWLSDIAAALAAAHKKGLVHRDVKPENVMVRDDGVVKVLDFGIARRATGNVDPSAPTQGTALPTLTKTGVNIGTPSYMAPEQIRNAPLDGRADQFAWGVVAYETLAGRLPWRSAGDPLAVVASILTDEPDPAPLDAADAPPHVKAAILRALSKKPDDRFAGMDDLVRALVPTGPPAASNAGPPEPAQARPGAPGPRLAAAKPASTTTLHRYSTEEVRQILSQAIDQQEQKREGARLGFDDLLDAAREVGVDEATLREASRDLRARAAVSLEMEDFTAWKRRKRRAFMRHLGVYAVVNVAMIIFFVVVGAPIQAIIQTPLWWGIAIGIHGLRALGADEDEYREEREKREKRERRRRRSEERREAVGRAIEQGAALLVDTGSALRKRIAGEKEAAGKVRIATPTRRRTEAEVEAAAAELEAAAEEESRGKRRRR